MTTNINPVNQNAFDMPEIEPATDQELQTILNNIRNDHFFLGNNDIVNYVDWHEDLANDLLIIRNTVPGGPIYPTIVTFVGIINNRGSRLKPDGGWNGELGFQGNFNRPQPFEDAKMKITIRKPINTIFANYYDTSVTSAHTIIARKRTHRAADIYNTFIDGNIFATRHSIFTRRTDDMNDNTDIDLVNDYEDIDDNPAFDIESLPCSSENSLNALHRIINDNRYEVNHLTAFTLDKRRIPPHAYEHILPGALVLAQATVTHQVVSGHDSYFMDIANLTVLRPYQPPAPVAELNTHKPILPAAVRNIRPATF